MALDNIPVKKIGDPFLFQEMNEMVAQIRKNVEDIGGVSGGFQSDVSPTYNLNPTTNPKGIYAPLQYDANYGPTGNKYIHVPANPDINGDSYDYKIINNGTTLTLQATKLPTGDFATKSELGIKSWEAGEYKVGDQVSYNGFIFQAQSTVTADESPNVSAKWVPILDIFNQSAIYGFDSSFDFNLTSWAIGAGSPTMSINGTAPGKMSLKFSGSSQNESVTLQNKLKIGRYYRISLKAALVAGAQTTVQIGNFTTSSGAFKISLTPNSTEKEYSFIMRAFSSSFTIGVLAANNNGATFTFDDLTAYELTTDQVKLIDLGDVKNFGALGDGDTDDLAPLQSALTYYTENGFTEKSIKFINGVFRMSDLINITSFQYCFITGIGATIKSSIINAANRHLLSVNNGGSVSVNNLHVDINNDPKLVQALRLYKLSGTVEVNNYHAYNFVNNNQIGLYLEDVTKSPSLSIANYLPSPSIIGCKFYNRQQVNITSYDYTNSTFKGVGIDLGLNAEYVQIIGCNFYGIAIGVRSSAGANSTISTCIFEQCDPTQVSSDTGIVHVVDNSTGNNGKFTITGCKFNHNFGYAIVSKYTPSERGNIISNNHFIVNSWTPIRIDGGGYNMIYGNKFNRNNEQQTLNGYPFTVGEGCGIELNNTLRNVVQCNYFDAGMQYGVKSTGTSNGNHVKDNTYRGLTGGITSMVGSTNVIRNNDSI